MNSKMLSIFSIVLFAVNAQAQNTETGVANQALETDSMWSEKEASSQFIGEDEAIGLSNWYKPLSQMIGEDETLGYRSAVDMKDDEEVSIETFGYQSLAELNEENELIYGTVSDMMSMNDEEQMIGMETWYRPLGELNEENESQTYTPVVEMKDDEQVSMITPQKFRNEDADEAENISDFSLEQDSSFSQEEDENNDYMSSTSYWTYVAGGSLITFSILSLIKIEKTRRENGQQELGYERIPDSIDPELLSFNLEGPTYTML